MSYIGLPPKATFSSGLLDRFTSSTGTTVTLTHDIASENDIVVFVNFVKQDSTTYSVGGTGNKTLTLGGTLVSSDIVEVHYLNIVSQTVAPSSGSVGSSQLTADSITGQTAETSIADDDTIIIHDTSASSLKKMTKANFVSGIGGTNTPTFRARLTTDQSISNTTHTKVQFNTEDYDTASAYDNSTNYRFTVPSGQAGKYFITTSIYLLPANESNLSFSTVSLRKNGTTVQESNSDFRGGRIYNFTNFLTGILDLSVGDYLEVFAYTSATSTVVIKNSNAVAGSLNIFNGFKIIE